VDVAGRPVIDVRGIVEKIWDSLDLDTSTILTPEEFEEIIVSGESFKAILQQKVQEAMQAQAGAAAPANGLPAPTKPVGKPETKSMEQKTLE
jgi:hypothetical protein